MAFKESLKAEGRRKSDGKCALCHKPFVEIHHMKMALLLLIMQSHCVHIATIYLGIILVKENN